MDSLITPTAGYRSLFSYANLSVLVPASYKHFPRCQLCCLPNSPLYPVDLDKYESPPDFAAVNDHKYLH